MNRDYDKEIQDLKNRISVLQEEKQSKERETFPDIVGRYFSVAVTCCVKVTEVLSYDKGFNEVNADCISVHLWKDTNDAAIDTNSNYGIGLENEITEEKFIEFYKEAKNIIENRIG